MAPALQKAYKVALGKGLPTEHLTTVGVALISGAKDVVATILKALFRSLWASFPAFP